LPTNRQSVQIVNYRWFRALYNYRKEGVVLNKENHLPVYSCEIMAAITSTNEFNYIHRESITIIADYLRSATAPDGEFRNHAIVLLEGALNPLNNTLLEVIKRHLSTKPALTTTQSFFQPVL